VLRNARVIRVRGVVQGVGFRPFTYRLARRLALGGWVKNGGDGVEIFVEGDPPALDAFAQALVHEAPAAARIASTDTRVVPGEGLETFEIRESGTAGKPTVRIAPDLAICDACLRELFDPADRRYRYPYINCTDCGPRYSIVRGLPYDRPRTTMAAWSMCERCAAEYHDPADRRFHAQPVACPACGPAYAFEEGRTVVARGHDAVVAAAQRLRSSGIIAIKGIGGYHLACDPENPTAVAALRERKFRKERPFALMARDLATARSLIVCDTALEAELESSARPIVLGEARVRFAEVAPANRELGVMLPYAPLHHLLFAAGAPAALVLTSANRSNEPLAYDDDDARAQLADIADAFLVGERAIARRIDDSLVRVAHGTTAMLRRARGYAPAVVATLPVTRPILALGGDLKNTVALVVAGEVFASQHVGDLEQHSAREAYETTVRDLCTMYSVDPGEALVVHDAHPEYFSSAFARELRGDTSPVQHHRAHVASVLAERGELETEVLGIAFDGTGYGDDGTIWGGEIFRGSLRDGLTRVAHLRAALSPGGDAAARFPMQAAAGFVQALGDVPDLTQAPFDFGERYVAACSLVAHDIRCFATSSVGRLFDVAAALLGFTREMTFEGQAAMWLEHLAASAGPCAAYAFPLADGELDYRPLLRALIADRLAERDAATIARAFHESVADAVAAVGDVQGELPVVCSGGVFQNRLLAELIVARLGERAWFNRIVPPSDGGLALGQAALAACARTARL